LKAINKIREERCVTEHMNEYTSLIARV